MFRALLLGALVFAATSQAEAPLRSLGIFLAFESVPAQISVQAMKDEVAQILKPAGFEVHWRSLEENQGLEKFANIVVLKFRGMCTVPRPLSGDEPSDREGPLASTVVTNGDVLPFSEILCDAVTRILPDAPGDRQKTLGKILGRVVVHELYHSLANTTRHTSRGLSKAAQSALELALGSARLEDSVARSMRFSFRK